LGKAERDEDFSLHVVVFSSELEVESCCVKEGDMFEDEISLVLRGLLSVVFGV
jgi:hypothetical protein